MTLTRGLKYLLVIMLNVTGVLKADRLKPGSLAIIFGAGRLERRDQAPLDSLADDELSPLKERLPGPR